MPSAIILGVTGQDGTLLSEFLAEKGYRVIGIGRTRITTNTEAWKNRPPVDISDFSHVADLVREIQPDEIYHLAAIHHSSQDTIPDAVSLFHQSYGVNVLSLVNFLEAIRLHSPGTRLFYAASSHLFGQPATVPQDETTRINPVSVYGITKASGLYLCRTYREVHHVFAAVGILYNHESWLRGRQFVSRKIVDGAVRCRADPMHRIVLGDPASAVDWGYAPDYVDAMHRILGLDEPDDFVIASGEKHTVEEFARIAFDAVGLDWRDHVDVQKGIITRPAVPLVGNPARLQEKTGWRRSMDFAEMVKTLVRRAEGEHGQ